MIVTVRAILINLNNHCLFVQHNERNPDDLGKWATVGGRQNQGETHEACLMRELNEEFGTSVEGKLNIGPKIFENFQPNRIDYFYVVWFDGKDVRVQADDEILNHKWCSKEDSEKLNLFFGFESKLYRKALLLK